MATNYAAASFHPSRDPGQMPGGRITISADMTFLEASAVYMEMRAPASTNAATSPRYIRKTTERGYRQHIGSLALFFGDMRLSDIRWFHIREYQKARAAGDEPFIRRRRPQDRELTPCSAKPKQVNQELGLLKNLLQRSNSWSKELEDLYEPLLDDDEEMARALDPDEQHRWLHTCQLSPKWNIVYWYSLLALGTCMSTDELRGLRLADISLDQRVVSIARKTAKNKYRSRTIELVGADVLWAIQHLLSRARELGSNEPRHYLFPSRVSLGAWNPEKPMSESGIKRQWEEVRAASKLTWFRQYDCRHTAITRLAEAGVPVDVIMARAGHVSEKMRRHYTHISQSSQRQWLEHSYSSRYPAPPTSFRHSSPWSRPAPPREVPQWQPATPAASTGSSPEEVITEMMRAMQEKLGWSPDQVREAVAQSNVVSFRPR